MAQPSSVTNAVRLMWLGAVLSIVSLVLVVAQTDAIKEEITKEAGLGDDIDGLYNLAIGVGVVFGLIGTGLWVWMAVMNDKPGKNWARILATVFGGLYLAFGTLGLIGGAIGGQTTLNTAINVITLIIAVLAIFMWQGSSTAWYTRRS